MLEKKTCLFSAPYSFLGEQQQRIQENLPTEFREIWYREDLVPNDNLYAWIPNPGQRFTIDDEVLKNFPSLKVVVTPSTGTNHIDKEACQRHGVAVYGLLDDQEVLHSIRASAEFTFLLLLNSLRRMDFAVKEVSDGRWRENEDDMRGFELYGKQVGLVGMGRIGQNIARWCRAFDADVAYYDPYVKVSEYPSWDLEKIFSESDVVCLCCFLTDETKGMINKNLLEKLKQGASLVNTSRGEVIEEKDLIQVLNNRKDLKVVMDVLTGEVTNTHMNSELVQMHKEGRIVITPHIAGATFESQTKAAMGALRLLKKHMSSKL